MMPHPVEVVVRIADAGDTFVSWTWLTPPYEPEVSRLATAQLAPPLTSLTASLLGSAHHANDPDDGVERLRSGIFCAARHEEALTELTAAVLPAGLADQIAKKSAPQPVRVRLCPSPRLAQVPWELLKLPDGRRLIEAAVIVHDPPTSFYSGRRRQPADWCSVADRPVVYVLDPVLQNPAFQVLPNDSMQHIRGRLAELRAAGRLYGGDLPQNPRATVTRDLLSDALRTPVSRLFFLGHISSDTEEPGTAALHLSDTPRDVRGMHRAVAGNLPLSALDLLVGTTLIEDPSTWRYYGADGPELGDDIWPMPARVALIACEGSVDYRTVETYGLVIAILNAGAGLVTTTRWPLPSDNTFRRADERCRRVTTERNEAEVQTICPTTELALEVDRAHDGTDPVAALRRWQIEQLGRWLADPDDLRYSPLAWAALTHTCAPKRTD